MIYTYLITYSYQLEGAGVPMFGNLTLKLDRQIERPEDIEVLRKAVMSIHPNVQMTKETIIIFPPFLLSVEVDDD